MCDYAICVYNCIVNLHQNWSEMDPRFVIVPHSVVVNLEISVQQLKLVLRVDLTHGLLLGSVQWSGVQWLRVRGKTRRN